MNKCLELATDNDLSKVWTFTKFEEQYGQFEGFRYCRRSICGKPFKLCIFRNDRETRASLYSGIETWSEEYIRAHSDQLYVGQLRDSLRFTVFDESWEDWIKVCLVLKDTYSKCLEVAAWKEMDNLLQEEELLNEVVETTSYRDFKDNYFCLRFIGYDYYPPTYDGAKVYTFMNSERAVIKVFSPLGFSIDSIEEHMELFDVVLKKHGYYEFLCKDSSYIVSKPIVLSFEDEWVKYEDINQKKEEFAEKKRREQEIQRQKDRNADRFPYDLSGDDSSLDPRMW